MRGRNLPMRYACDRATHALLLPGVLRSVRRCDQRPAAAIQAAGVLAGAVRAQNGRCRMTRKQAIAEAWNMSDSDGHLAMCRAYDLGRIAGLREAVKLRHLFYREIPETVWRHGHDDHAETCRDRARELARKLRGDK